MTNEHQMSEPVKNTAEPNTWTQFSDMCSGGGRKEKWDCIWIEAPEDEARVIFNNRFGHDPSKVTCTCCGSDYSVYEETPDAEDRNGSSLFITAADIKPEERIDKDAEVVPVTENMSARKFYRTVITVEVLSDEPYEFDGLEATLYDITDGHFSGDARVTASSALNGKQAADAGGPAGRRRAVRDGAQSAAPDVRVHHLVDRVGVVLHVQHRVGLAEQEGARRAQRRAQAIDAETVAHAAGRTDDDQRAGSRQRVAEAGGAHRIEQRQ